MARLIAEERRQGSVTVCTHGKGMTLAGNDLWVSVCGMNVSVFVVLTALSDGSRRGQVSVLAVHVVGSTARVVTQPDAEVLHLER